MKTLAVFLSLLIPVGIMANVNVTFRVDMTNQIVDPNGVHLAGGFGAAGYPDWDPSGIQMTDPDLDNIYEVVLNLAEATGYEFKFINGNAWGNAEVVVGSCNCNFGNRCHFTSIVDHDLQVFCFGECSFCGNNPQFQQVTFRVNMQEQTVSPDGVHLAGSFGSNPAPYTYPEWDPAGILMTDIDADLIFEVTLNLAQGYNYQFKYVNGNIWGGNAPEIVPLGCEFQGNRTITVEAADILLNTVCFGSCENCLNPGCTDPDASNFDPTALSDDGSCTFNVTFNVDMSLYAGGFSGVNVVGDFNAWSNTSNPMSDPESDGTWTVTISVPQGDHQYLFYIPDGDEYEAFALSDPCAIWGGTSFNRQFYVGGEGFDLPMYCFNSCYACQTVEVILSVNMAGQIIAPEGVYLAGSFNGWFPTLMQDSGNGVWSASVYVQAGNYFEYKFVNGDDLDNEAELITGDCTAGFLDNRYFIAPFENTAWPTYCFAECTECPVSVLVRFRVDMSNETVSPEGVHLAGSFQGWDPAATPMNPIGYGIYELIVELNPYSFIEFKYINGDAWGENEEVPSECGFSEFNNRYFNTYFSDINLPVVCYGSCELCPGCTDPFSAEYSPFAGSDDGSCSTPVIFGCTYPQASNYNVSASIDDGSCLFDLANPCPADLNEDGVVGVTDLLAFISLYGTTCP